MRPEAAITFGPVLFLLQWFCFLQTAHAQGFGENTDCTNDDQTEIMACLGPVISDLPAVVQCKVDCSKLTTVVLCMNTAAISDKCIISIPAFVNNIFTTFGASCTYKRLKDQCPSSPALRTPEGQTTQDLSLTTSKSTKKPSSTQSNYQYSSTPPEPTQYFEHSSTEKQNNTPNTDTTTVLAIDNLYTRRTTSSSHDVNLTNPPGKQLNTTLDEQGSQVGTTKNPNLINSATHAAMSWLLLMVLCAIMI